jgi:hypothetical protein
MSTPPGDPKDLLRVKLIAAGAERLYRAVQAVEMARKCALEVALDPDELWDHKDHAWTAIVVTDRGSGSINLAASYGTMVEQITGLVRTGEIPAPTAGSFRLHLTEKGLSHVCESELDRYRSKQ